MPEYIGLKYKMMSESPFRFFRGTCHLFYEDLFQKDSFQQYPISWICGDLHLENFGSFKGNNRLVYFDLNDYDEALLAPVTWELARMVTSIFVGFHTMKISSAESMKMAKLFLQTYSEVLGHGKALYIEPQTATGIVKSFLLRVENRKQKDLVSEYAENSKAKDRKAVFRRDKPRLFNLSQEEKRELSDHMTNWMKKNHQKHYSLRILDVNFRIAGTGSIGVQRYVFLAQSMLNPKKHMLIDMKQELPSCILPFVKTQQPAWESEALRVASIQERMQNVAPALLGTTLFNNISYVIKELQPTADKIDFELIKDKYQDMEEVIRDMAMMTASAQLRSAGRQGSAVADELMAFGQDTHWQQAIIDYAHAYAEQTNNDYLSFKKEYQKGFFK